MKQSKQVTARFNIPLDNYVILEIIVPTNHMVDTNEPFQTATKLKHKKNHKQQLQITTSVQTNYAQ